MARRKYSSVFYAFFTLILALSGSAAAQKNENATTQNIRIKNFGQMDDRFYRGAQPSQGDYQSLGRPGIKTIIDLREDPESYEKTSVEALGMRYVNIPMSDKNYPPSALIDQFLRLVDDPTTGKFFVHCAGGRHRTGVMGAVYRFNHYHWGFDQVYAEMKNYDFYTRWGHGEMKKFVEDYAVNFQNNTAVTQTSAGSDKQK